MTATELKKRAISLAEKTKIDSVTPEEVGQLSKDIVEYIENVEINGSSLGIRKTYTSVSAMEADSTAPKDDKGVLLRRGMLVNIYNQEDPDSADNGKVFSFQNPGWAFRGTVDAGYATKEKLTELENKSIINNGYLTGDFFTIPRCYWNNKGELSALESCKCTPFIPFKKGDELIANGTTKSAGFDNCNFFDKYNVFISSITIQSSQEELVVKEYNTPENTRFITLNALLEAETSVEINGINNRVYIE